MQGYRTIDLNIFYREEWDEVKKTAYYTDFFSIEAYIYESDGEGTRRYDTGIVLDCDEYETQYLAEQFPMSEYGYDFWIFRDEVEMPSRRIAKILGDIKIDRFDMEPSQVITDSSTM